MLHALYGSSFLAILNQPLQTLLANFRCIIERAAVFCPLPLKSATAKNCFRGFITWGKFDFFSPFILGLYYLKTSGASSKEQYSDGEGNGLDPICLQPKIVGKCRAAMPRWYYDKESKGCKNFIYGGCDANDNNVRTKEDCDKKCHQPWGEWSVVLVRALYTGESVLFAIRNQNGEKQFLKGQNTMATQYA